MELQKQLGIIRTAEFGKIVRGFVSFNLDFDFGGMRQGFGGYGLCSYDKSLDRRIGTAAGLDLLIQMLDLFQVRQFHEIAGKHAYAYRKTDRFNERIIGVGRTEPDGGKVFLIGDWQKQWGLERDDG